MRQTAIRALAVVRLLRPLNVLLSLVGVAVGAVLASGSEAFSEEHWPSVLLAMLSAAAIGGSANAVNDAVDVDIDRVNRPMRPIPSGLVDVRTAHICWLAAAAVGIGLSLFLTFAHVLIAIFSFLATTAYSFRLKREGLVGNLTVSVVVSIALVYGGLATGQIGYSWVGFIAAFLLTMARELVKDLEDVEGDLSQDMKSFPIVHGEPASRAVVNGLLAVTILLSPLPYASLGFSGGYLVAVAATCVILLLVLQGLAAGSRKAISYSKASALLKVAMVAGMAALLLS